MALDMSAMFGKKKAGGAERDGSRSRPAPKTVMIERPDRGRAIGLVDRLLSFPCGGVDYGGVCNGCMEGSA